MDAAGYLKQFTPSVFPVTFEHVLHPFFGSILSKSSDARVAVLDSQFAELTEKIASIEWPSGDPIAETPPYTTLKSSHIKNMYSDASPAASERIVDRPTYLAGEDISSRGTDALATEELLQVSLCKTGSTAV